MPTYTHQELVVNMASTLHEATGWVFYSLISANKSFSSDSFGESQQLQLVIGKKQDLQYNPSEAAVGLVWGRVCVPVCVRQQWSRALGPCVAEVLLRTDIRVLPHSPQNLIKTSTQEKGSYDVLLHEISKIVPQVMYE